MTALFGETHSGADHQAEAVRCYLQVLGTFEKEMWHSVRQTHVQAEPYIFNWYNGREHGYVVTLKSWDLRRQLNVAFYEHRIGDNICALVWEQNLGIKAPTIDNAQLSEEYMNDHSRVTHSVPYGKPREMAKWIYDTLEDFWNETCDEVTCQCAKRAKVVATSSE